MTKNLLALRCFLLLSCLATRVGPARAQDAAAPSPAQIHWQRTLADALRIAREEHRPLLVAINVDGESASDRIVTERYRDPRFVEWTRSFACVVASPSRHNARDHDQRGRRIPCPRLGRVTCGEHVALEPVLFDAYLGGERVSPRHALVSADGTKAFDLAYLFDLHELDAPLESAARAAPTPAAPRALPRSARELAPKDESLRATQWRDLAASRDHAGRETFEDIVASLTTEAGVLEALRAVRERGDPGSAEVLRLVLGREPPPSAALVAAVGDSAAALEIGPALAAIVRDRLRFSIQAPGGTGLGADRALLGLLARFDAANAATRSLLLALQALGPDADRRAAAVALAPRLDARDVERVAGAIEDAGGPVELDVLLRLASRVGREVPRRPKPEDAPLDDAAIDRELVAADAALAADPSDRAHMLRFGRASLARARRIVETRAGDPRLHLEDAATWLGRAALDRHEDAGLQLELARVAYLRGRFDEEERCALEAFRAWPRGDAFPAAARALTATVASVEGDARRALSLLDDDSRLEALRWLGDGAARQLGTRSGGDPSVEIAGIVRGLRSLAIVAVSPNADETDWTSLASFLGALGLFREEIAAWQAGIERWPEAPSLREGLQRALWNVGRVDVGPEKAERIATANQSSATCAWYAGYAWILAAEDARRASRPERAISAYAAARARFESSRVLDPKFDASARHFAGMCAFGTGFALLALDRRSSAADQLVDGLVTCPTVGTARDGLDREFPDLVDGILEWREGSKDEVNAVVLAQRLAGAEPDDPRGPLAVADSELREGLRADGRSKETRVSPSGAVERAPSAEGDFYLRRSIAAARLAIGIVEDDATRRQLAQSLTVQAERLLARSLVEEARPLLAEAARWLGLESPEARNDVASLRDLAARLRASLGEARPVFRPGR